MLSYHRSQIRTGTARMLRLGICLLLAVSCTGCVLFPNRATDTPWETQNAADDNPLLIRSNNPIGTWEIIVDVLDDYFEIDQERPIRQLPGTMTEGRIDTYPRIGATLLEPWYRDSVGFDEKLECTLQSIQRRAVVRVIPVPEGFLVDVSVYKELENARRPDNATAGSTTFRNDMSLNRIETATPDFPTHAGWIPQGRDQKLETRIIQHLNDQFHPGR